MDLQSRFTVALRAAEIQAHPVWDATHTTLIIETPRQRMVITPATSPADATDYGPDVTHHGLRIALYTDEDLSSGTSTVIYESYALLGLDLATDIEQAIDAMWDHFS